MAGQQTLPFLTQSDVLPLGQTSTPLMPQLTPVDYHRCRLSINHSLTLGDMVGSCTCWKGMRLQHTGLAVTHYLFPLVRVTCAHNLDLLHAAAVCACRVCSATTCWRPTGPRRTSRAWLFWGTALRPTKSAGRDPRACGPVQHGLADCCSWWTKVGCQRLG
jgi:hypothetical protein